MLYITWGCAAWGLPASGEGVAILPGPAVIAKVCGLPPIPAPVLLLLPDQSSTFSLRGNCEYADCGPGENPEIDTLSGVLIPPVAAADAGSCAPILPMISNSPLANEELNASRPKETSQRELVVESSP